MYLFFLLETLVSQRSVFLWKCISTKLMGQDLVSGPRGLVVKIQYSHCSGLTSVSGLETKVLLQAAAG